MASKFFTWTKGDRRNAVESMRIGGLLPIEPEFADTRRSLFPGESAKSTPRPEQRPKPPNLTIIPDYNTHAACLTPASALHNAALSSVSSASNLLAVVNDMLRSPALTGSVCSNAPALHKPLPGRPRSISLPPSPVELPGSILQLNQGFPPASPVDAGSATSQTMRSVRSGNLLSPTLAGPRSDIREAHSGIPQHKKSLSEVSIQRRSRSRPNLVTSPSSTDSKLTTCSVSTNGGQASSGDSTRARAGSDNSRPSQPLPLIVDGKKPKKIESEVPRRRNETATTSRSAPRRQLEELKSTITAQDNTISTLSAQFASLRSSHEAHIASLTEAHGRELETLKTYTKALEEQQSQRTLHHASSNHLLLLLDTSEPPQSPDRDQTFQQNTSESSANSLRSFQTALEQQPRSAVPRDSPDMDNLKRKLTATKRETRARDAVPELNQLRQTNEALQRQVESLMTKLNQSKQNERDLRVTLEHVEETAKTWQEKVERLEKSEKALQNTVDHLEGRLTIANIEKVDAQEELHNFRLQQSPFDKFKAKASATTVFSTGAASALTAADKDPTMISAFVANIERLQDQLKEKDSRIAALQRENEQCRLDYDDLEHDHKKLNKTNDELELRADVNAVLLEKSKSADAKSAQLEGIVREKETIIKEKEMTIRAIEQQLDHHQTLLYAELRRQANMAIYSGEEHSLAELKQLYSKEGVDRWIERLRLRCHKATSKDTLTAARPSNELEDQIADLKKEIDFYVREMIYFKMDVRGYKHDIKKLQTMAAHIGHRTGEADSPTPSVCNRCSSDASARPRFTPSTPGLGISASPSPISAGLLSTAGSLLPSTPTTSAPISTPHLSPSRITKPGTIGIYRKLPQSPLGTPDTPKTPPRKAGRNVANEADNIDPGVSPRSVCLTPERRKPTPPSPKQEQMGDMATNFPLSTPAAPKRHDTQRSNSDSIITMYATARTPDWAPPNDNDNMATDGNEEPQQRERSSSLPGGDTPDRPARPRYGLFQAPNSADRNLPSPPKMNVLAEAERHSPQGQQQHRQTQLTASTPTPGPPSTPNRERKGSLGSGSGNNIPFVISMGSPHNPALTTPTGRGLSTPDQTASNSASKPKRRPGPLPSSDTAIFAPTTNPQPPPKSAIPSPRRAGLGGTMASSNPGSSLPTASSGVRSQLPSPSYPGTMLPAPTSASRSALLGSTQPRPSGHSRTASAGSLVKGKGKTRKDSISGPILGAPFGGGGGGIGEAW